jgi:hypothetical protein
MLVLMSDDNGYRNPIMRSMSSVETFSRTLNAGVKCHFLFAVLADVEEVAFDVAA